MIRVIMLSAIVFGATQVFGGLQDQWTTAAEDRHQNIMNVVSQ